MTTFAVQNDTELSAAVAKAQPGDRVILAAGTYGPLKLYGRRLAAPGVRLQAAKGARATIQGGLINGRFFNPLSFGNCAGFTFDGLELSGKDGVIVAFGGLAERLVVRNCDIHGPIVGPDEIRKYPAPAVSFGKGAIDCAIENCDIHHAGGVSGISPVRARIVGNRIHDARGDGIQFAPGEDMLIEGNEITDLYSPVAAHFDGIQFFTANLKEAPKGIVIRRNRLLRGKGDPFQSIFANNEASLPYRGVVIEENLVAGGQYHGISLRLAEGPVIRRNYVTGDAGSLDAGRTMTPWIKLVESTDAVVTDNITTAGPIFDKTTVMDKRGNKAIKLPRANDSSAAEAWWAKLSGGPRTENAAAHLTLGLVAMAAAAAPTHLAAPATRRRALAEMLAALVSRARL